MGRRNEIDDLWITQAMDATDGNITAAAKWINDNYFPEHKVTRQNLHWWIDERDMKVPQEQADHNDLLRTNRRLTLSNNKLRREARHNLDCADGFDNVMASIEEAIRDFDPPAPPVYPPADIEGKSITIELLFSDIQIGKLMDDYDSNVARRRLDEWLQVVVQRIYSYRNNGYAIEKIVFACLGDIIESDKKHDNSGRACDIGTADQLKIGIELLYGAIYGLAQIGVPMDIIMITGNHDHDGHGLNMFKPGREHLSWPMYHAVRMLCQQTDLNVSFYIPEGSFHLYELYGQKVLYEHGVGIATSEAAMSKHVSNRTRQIKQYITLFRMGDKHSVCRFNNDRLVVNGAFFGDSRTGEEYSGIVGYDGEPAQLLFAHCKRDDDFRTSIFDSLSIQLGHVK